MFLSNVKGRQPLGRRGSRTAVTAGADLNAEFLRSVDYSLACVVRMRTQQRRRDFRR